jgi:hypothetical protein
MADSLRWFWSDEERPLSVVVGSFQRMDISVQTTSIGPLEPPHPLGSPRPDDLPISSAAGDAAKATGGDAKFLVGVLFEAIQALEAELIPSRTAR